MNWSKVILWNNAKTDITEADQRRLIESLKKLTNGEQIDSVVDVEQIIRYFVVHNYVCNGDSYTGSMIHNYYLYEENGQLKKMVSLPCCRGTTIWHLEHSRAVCLKCPV
ncbi:MAG: CotH kinase family protein [Peptoniphilaceae bacterium]|nr:CotH kinase family protein [Peptoniphilaceae bacterium]